MPECLRFSREHTGLDKDFAQGEGTLLDPVQPPQEAITRRARSRARHAQLIGQRHRAVGLTQCLGVELLADRHHLVPAHGQHQRTALAAAGLDEGAAPALAGQQALLVQHGECVMHGHARHAELAAKLFERRNARALTPFAAFDMAAEDGGELEVNRLAAAGKKVA